jgi:uncharacterized membrane protein
VVVYSLTAALVIGGDEKTYAVVPIVAILAIIVVYRRLQTSAFTSIQLASALTQVARRGREVIDGLYIANAPVSDPIDGPGRPSAAVSDIPVQEICWPRPPAVLQVIDVPRVLRAAERARAVIDFKVGSGQMIAEGSTVAVVSGPAEPGLERQIFKSLTVGEERTFEQDPAFALRLLADIALRALSPAVNDPTTAVEALDAMDGLLRALATRELSVERVAGRDGTIRVRLVLPTWDDYVAVALDEIIALPALSPNVPGRILRLLDELAVIVPPSTRSALEAPPRPRRSRLIPQRARLTPTTAEARGGGPCTRV